ncbi:CLUMA_CG011366, isoform A [Clunio marinus]|uniref:CLUMA_CG011366, isoform A n=1 Tax=Clunio marinus TaxID=568069 RepID=A0A1J1ICI8_9DIPT|nr:CLUMA_CG011366, isoform A [Clunio marinus]
MNEETGNFLNIIACSGAFALLAVWLLMPSLNIPADKQSYAMNVNAAQRPKNMYKQYIEIFLDEIFNFVFLFEKEKCRKIA